MHVTAPLMERPSGVKVQLNRLLGRLIWGDAANLKRSTFNEKLRAAYAGEPIFDLAAVESTRPDGSRESLPLPRCRKATRCGRATPPMAATSTRWASAWPRGS